MSYDHKDYHEVVLYLKIIVNWRGLYDETWRHRDVRAQKVAFYSPAITFSTHTANDNLAAFFYKMDQLGGAKRIN